ncbi:MAG: hypothetical protein HY260_09070 [Chloroflexi bacterium]|nr:hypothetical protein [Chloroflexota bacterium]
MHLYIAILFWLHELGISIWVGSSLLMPLLILPTLPAIDPAGRPKFMEALSKRLAALNMIAIAVVVLTGILQTRAIFGLQYLLGINLLVIKIIVAVLMIANGVYVGLVLARKSVALAPTPGQPPSAEFLKTQRLLVTHSWIQAGLSVIVLFLVGLLTAP